MTIIRSNQVKHYKLRKDVTAILASIPNAADHAQGIMFVMDDVLHSRMVREGGSESSATRKHHSYYAIPGNVRSRISKALNEAIADSGLRAFDAWGDAIYGPLDDIENAAQAA